MEQTCAYCLSDRYESGGAGLICTADAYAAVIGALACGRGREDRCADPDAGKSGEDGGEPAEAGNPAGFPGALVHGILL